jgi:hypothetical protein
LKLLLDIQPNHHLTSIIISSLQANTNIASMTNDTLELDECSTQPRSELDSHANIVVLGRNSFIFESTGRSCTVHPFSTELGKAENVPIVDGAIVYEDPHTGEPFILIVQNALYIPSMQINLLPPFIMRVGGVKVNDVPKIHCNYPTTSDHCISF